MGKSRNEIVIQRSSELTTALSESICGGADEHRVVVTDMEGKQKEVFRGAKFSPRKFNRLMRYRDKTSRLQEK